MLHMPKRRSHSREASFTAALLVLGLVLPSAQAEAGVPIDGRPIARFETDLGSFEVELCAEDMPRTVANFIEYERNGAFDGSVIHRNAETQEQIEDPENPGEFIIVTRPFVIQGGGFFLFDPTPPGQIISFSSVAPFEPIDDEAGGCSDNPSNLRGTIAMAKSGPDTATSQWFINLGDNSVLDDPQRPDGGFAPFGRVLGDGMDVVDAIAALDTPPDLGFALGSPFAEIPLRGLSFPSTLPDVRVANTVTVPEPGAGALGLAALAALAARAARGRPRGRG